MMEWSNPAIVTAVVAILTVAVLLDLIVDGRARRQFARRLAKLEELERARWKPRNGVHVNNVPAAMVGLEERLGAGLKAAADRRTKLADDARTARVELAERLTVVEAAVVTQTDAAKKRMDALGQEDVKLRDNVTQLHQAVVEAGNLARDARRGTATLAKHYDRLNREVKETSDRSREARRGVTMLGKRCDRLNQEMKDLGKGPLVEAIGERLEVVEAREVALAKSVERLETQALEGAAPLSMVEECLEAVEYLKGAVKRLQKQFAGHRGGIATAKKHRQEEAEAAK